MGIFIDLANKLNNDIELKPVLEECEVWESFKNGELTDMNELNERALAGHLSKNPDDDLTNNYETNMEKLFGRFTKIKEYYDAKKFAKYQEEEPEEEEEEKEDDEATDISTKPRTP